MRAIALLLTAVLFLPGCSKPAKTPDAPGGGHDHTRGGGHHHAAPHGGTLVVFGEEFAHLELVLDAKEGALKAYVLDGHAENAIRLPQAGIALALSDVRDAENKVLHAGTVELELAARANELSGEKPGDTSEFAGAAGPLKGAARFKGEVLGVTIKGIEFKRIGFAFPEGNEGEGHGEHDH
ncbi:MAG: hypothetical protein L6R28_25090 [Planctomycetes bacterium]|nr:hypothetical protein [Planctomycetota bacterium]